MGHLKQHSFTGNTDHDFTGLSNNYLPKLNSSGTGLTSSQIFDNAIAIGIGVSLPEAKLNIKATGATSAGYALWIEDSTALALFRVRNDGSVGINAVPTAGDRLFVTAGAARDGAINISASNLADNGYAILAQGGTASASYNGFWSDVSQEGTGTNRAFRGTSVLAGGSSNYAGDFNAKNGTSESIAVKGVIGGGDSVNSTDSAGVLGINSSQVTTNRKAVWGYISNDVDNGTSYGGKFESSNQGANAINYGIHAISNGSFSSATNYAGYFQANGASGAINYAIVTNGGVNGFGTITPTDMVHINGTTGSTQLRLEKSFTPTSSGNTSGNIGSVAWDNNYFYMKTNTGWGRVLWDYNF